MIDEEASFVLFTCAVFLGVSLCLVSLLLAVLVLS